MSVWLLASLVTKSLVYLAMLATGGGLFVSLLYPLKAITVRYLLPATIMGLLAVCLFFLVHIGQVNQQGVSGMFDMQLGAILAETTLGEGLRWRLAGFALVLIAAATIWLADTHSRFHGWIAAAFIVGLLGCIALAVSVAVLGHVNILDMATRVTAALHLLAVSVWIGALLPLLWVCQQAFQGDRYPGRLILLLRQFGQFGWLFLGLMVISGIWMAWQLLGSFSALLTTTHGRFLLAKLALVALLMALGASNKFFWVSRLAESQNRHGAVKGLRLTILMEIVLAVAVVVATALMTTVEGPVR
ncbi:MAG: hypothetical protein CMQ46_04670 [Gammaproteobacteria bacterium]|nr:hypothetical protein [Gammaproteobacteria bacterium]MBJ54542.1 hypothetical protein [Gammaproteobacteria bacterium]HBN15672.1 hypothetical protein [Pseudohongiella sp.]|tara:strand:- start:1132 stop:2037 length:906 start_codon:yes stop_codon:yes gene_type:complete